MARQRVWVLWARTWNYGATRLPKVTSKRAYQKYVVKIKLNHKTYKGSMLPAYAESLPQFYQESTDKAVLETMRDLAQPLSKGD